MEHDFENEAKDTLKKRFILFLSAASVCGLLALILFIVGGIQIANGVTYTATSSNSQTGQVTTSQEPLGPLAISAAVLFLTVVPVFLILMVKWMPSKTNIAKRVKALEGLEAKEAKKKEEAEQMEINRGNKAAQLTLAATILKVFQTSPFPTTFGLDETSGLVQFFGPFSKKIDDHGHPCLSNVLTPAIPVAKLKDCSIYSEGEVVENSSFSAGAVAGVPFGVAVGGASGNNSKVSKTMTTYTVEITIDDLDTPFLSFNFEGDRASCYTMYKTVLLAIKAYSEKK